MVENGGCRRGDYGFVILAPYRIIFSCTTFSARTIMRGKNWAKEGDRIVIHRLGKPLGDDHCTTIVMDTDNEGPSGA